MLYPLHIVTMRLKSKLIVKITVFIGVSILVIKLYSTSIDGIKDPSFDRIFLNGESIERESISKSNRNQSKLSETCIAKIPKSLSDLEEQFSWDKHWQWILSRVRRNWEPLLEAAHQEAKSSSNKEFINRTCLNILIMPGFLTATNFALTAYIGGPLGELLQWADLISALYVLGHRVSVRYDVRIAGIDLRVLRSDEGKFKQGCSSEEVDLIYTDMSGHANLPEDVQVHYRKKFRILDSFGTEVMYNVPEYAKVNKLERSAGLRNLNIQQFYTMYPETLDNSFLGFIVHPPELEVKVEIAILYGKEAKYLQGKEEFIRTLRKYMEIHATMEPHPLLSKLNIIQNHGVLSPKDYHTILSQGKYFVGLGDPIEGPGMMEALARGCIILQPKFIPARSLHDLGKPTNRSLTSQVPLLERKIGDPNVFTFDYNNMEEVKSAIQDLLMAQARPLVLDEFTPAGYLSRVNMYINEQQYCSPIPTENAVQYYPTVSTVPDMSCTEVCRGKGQVCDVTLFKHINKPDLLTKHSTKKCDVLFKSDVYAPAILELSSAGKEKETQCILQANVELFSCASYTSSDKIKRLCPCVECNSKNIHFCPYIYT